MANARGCRSQCFSAGTPQPEANHILHTSILHDLTGFSRSLSPLAPKVPVHALGGGACSTR